MRMLDPWAATSTVQAKIPPALLEALKSAARTHDRTISGQIRHALRQWYEREQAGGDDGRAV